LDVVWFSFSLCKSILFGERRRSQESNRVEVPIFRTAKEMRREKREKTKQKRNIKRKIESNGEEVF
jgi:hypothetical protein